MQEKIDLRKKALERRHAYVATLSEDSLERIALSLVERVQNYFNFPKHFVMGTYFPMPDEQNVRLLNFFLQQEGHVMAYPLVEASGVLSFRSVSSVKSLVKGSFGVMEAPESAPVVLPDLFFTPLLAFDSKCNRLGYGKGHFDRSLEMARQKRKVLAIGVAYDMQRVDEVPCEPFDQQLNYVVTESQVYKADIK